MLHARVCARVRVRVHVRVRVRVCLCVCARMRVRMYACVGVWSRPVDDELSIDRGSSQW